MCCVSEVAPAAGEPQPSGKSTPHQSEAAPARPHEAFTRHEPAQMSCKVPAAGQMSCLRLYKKTPVGQMTLLPFSFTRQPTPNVPAAPAASIQNSAFPWSCHALGRAPDGRPLWWSGSCSHGWATCTPGPVPKWQTVKLPRAGRFLRKVARQGRRIGWHEATR